MICIYFKVHRSIEPEKKTFRGFLRSTGMSAMLVKYPGLLKQVFVPSAPYGSTDYLVTVGF